MFTQLYPFMLLSMTWTSVTLTLLQDYRSMKHLSRESCNFRQILIDQVRTICDRNINEIGYTENGIFHLACIPKRARLSDGIAGFFPRTYFISTLKRLALPVHISFGVWPWPFIHLHFFQKFPRVLPVFAAVSVGSCVGPQNKTGHPAGCKFPCWVPVENK